MLKKIMPVVLALSGLGAGVGAGLALRPATDAGEEDHGTTDSAEHGAEGEHVPTEAHDGEEGHAETAEDHADGEAPALEYVKMSNQFVIPIVKDGRVASMVVLSLSLEAKAGSTEAIFTAKRTSPVVK